MEYLYHSIGAFLFFVLTGIVIIRRGFNQRLTRWLIPALLTFLLLELSSLAIDQGWVTVIPSGLVMHWGAYGALLAVIFLRPIGAIITSNQQIWGWFGAGLIWLGIALGFDSALNSWPDFLWSTAISFPSLERLIFGWLTLGWVIFTMATFGLSTQSYRFSRLPSARNRVFYWLASFSSLTLGSIFKLVDINALGTLFYGIGALILTIISVSPWLPSLSLIIRRAASTLIILLIEFSVYVLSFIGLQLLFESLTENHIYWLAAVMTVVVLVLINPLMKITEGWVNRIYFGEEQDLNRILRDFSQSISHTLDMALLTSVIVDLMRDVIGVNRGALISLEFETNEGGYGEYHLILRDGKEDAPPIGKFPVDSAIIKHWDNDRRSVTQMEIDILPAYAALSVVERKWLKKVDFDIFIPIHTKNEWVGLLALGPKADGASYFSEDIELLRTLADQTGVAMQNIRLVDSLLRVNHEFQRTYSAMEDAHIKLQRLERTKSDFITIASHELQTPLTKISGYSQMLLDEPEVDANPLFQKSISSIDDGAQRLQEIIESMLDVSKIDMQEFKLETNQVNIGQVLHLVCSDHAPAFQERKLDLQLDQSIDQMPDILGDGDALQRAFFHLVANAVKYTPDGGTVSIRSRHFANDQSSFPQGGLEIIVSDTGIGIDPRFKDLIFDKFYQTAEVDLHSSGKTKFKGGGPGLGLTIVRGIVQAHGGKVWVESPGYDEESTPGSQFHVILPLIKGPAHKDKH